MGKFLTYMKTLNESKDTTTVKMMDADYDVEIMDSTHLKMKSKGSDKWGIPLHFGQVRDEVLEQLRAKKMATDRFFITDK